MTRNVISYAALAVALATPGSVLAAAVAAPTVAPEPGANSAGPDESDIIVTGTRASGITAAESAAPIKVLDAATLQHVGQPNLNQVLTQLIPSFNAESVGGDTANLTLSARLRGLSPNQTLVLVDGKRRHGSANLHVLSGPFQGAAAPDLDLISPESIKRIEVLEDGAAAQYGSDALAGVINIILKDDDEGISGNVTGGQYYNTGGATYSGSVHIATKLGETGFVNLTLFHRFVDFTQQGGLDTRVTDDTGALKASLSPQQAALYSDDSGFPVRQQDQRQRPVVADQRVVQQRLSLRRHRGVQLRHLQPPHRERVREHPRPRPRHCFAGPRRRRVADDPGRADLRAVGLQPA